MDSLERKLSDANHKIEQLEWSLKCKKELIEKLYSKITEEDHKFMIDYCRGYLGEMIENF